MMVLNSSFLYLYQPWRPWLCGQRRLEMVWNVWNGCECPM